MNVKKNMFLNIPFLLHHHKIFDTYIFYYEHLIQIETSFIVNPNNGIFNYHLLSAI